MSAEDNKRIVLAYLAGDQSLLDKDMSWWTPGTGVLDREQFMTIVEHVRPQLASPMSMTVDTIIAEGDHVAVEARGSGLLKNGRVYANTYHFLYVLRDGKIVQQREHADTAYAHEVLGPEVIAAIKALETRSKTVSADLSHDLPL